MGSNENESKLREQIMGLVRDYPNFPSAGILFRDILPLFTQPILVDSLCEFIANKYKGKVDLIAGLEARGFLFGPIVACKLRVPFVPIRKKGKLPGPVTSVTYQKEYGEDVLELQTGVMAKDHRVLLVDDLLATGGTLQAAEQLVRNTGASVAGIFVIVELGELDGRRALNCPVDTLILYPH